jgi:hypothetical protein
MPHCPTSEIPPSGQYDMVFLMSYAAIALMPRCYMALCPLVSAPKSHVIVSPLWSLPLSGAKGSRVNSANYLTDAPAQPHCDHAAACCCPAARCHPVRYLPPVSMTWRFSAVRCGLPSHWNRRTTRCAVPRVNIEKPCHSEPFTPFEGKLCELSRRICIAIALRPLRHAVARKPLCNTARCSARQHRKTMS